MQHESQVAVPRSRHGRHEEGLNPREVMSIRHLFNNPVLPCRSAAPLNLRCGVLKQLDPHFQKQKT